MVPLVELPSSSLSSFPDLFFPDCKLKQTSSRIGVPPARAVRLRTTSTEPLEEVGSRFPEGGEVDIAKKRDRKRVKRKEKKNLEKEPFLFPTLARGGVQVIPLL